MAGSAQPQRPGGPGSVASSGSGRPELARMVETQIIPRLMLAHRGAGGHPNPGGLSAVRSEPSASSSAQTAQATHTVHASLAAAAPGARHPAPGPAQPQVTAQEVEQFARAVLAHGEEEVLEVLRDHLARAVPLDSLLLDLIAPTARLLGRLWEDDLCSFTEVTVGVGRLQSALRVVAATGQLEPARGEGPLRILLAPAPGEQHTLGLSMAEGFFRRAGWEVAGGSWSDGGLVPLLVSAEWFDVAGFSIGSETRLEALANAIRAVRHASCNPQILILVGGSLADANPQWVRELGADALAGDARNAPALAFELLSRHSCSRLRAG